MAAGERGRLEQLRRWRQAALWAPVVWFPGLVYGLLVGRFALAMTLGLAGLAFTALARGIVWLARCPRCGERFGASDAAFRRAWDAAGCLACGVSLFALRRGEQAGGRSARDR